MIPPQAVVCVLFVLFISILVFIELFWLPGRKPRPHGLKGKD